jgi:hypothetical protein
MTLGPPRPARRAGAGYVCEHGIPRKISASLCTGAASYSGRGQPYGRGGEEAG